jgi:hypothetical protein
MSDTLIRSLFVAQAASTVFMTGVIWFVQIVHYPLFAAIDRAGFAEYEQRHTALTTRVVAPAMLVEALSAVLLIWWRPSGLSNAQVSIGVALVVVVWLSTMFIQVPCHEALSKGFDTGVHERLVDTNWIRTVAWSLRAVLVTWMALAVFARRK